MLALAHHVERLVEEGTLRDYADAARKLGVTRARMAQVMGLLNLSAALQEEILSGNLAATERNLRPLTSEANWQQQQILA